MRKCESCGEAISSGRLKVFPNAEYCVECLENNGDVPRYVGIREKVGTKHLGGCEGDILRTPEQITKFYSWKKKQKNRYPQ